MSAAPDKSERGHDVDSEQEVDLGRVWRAAVARWWLLVVGLVAGAIIGLLVSLGGGRQWKATSDVYLGQPLSPGQASPISSPSTLLAQTTKLLESDAAIRQAAAKAGLKPAQLRGNVSPEPIFGITGGKFGTAAPLLAITVTGSDGAKVKKATDALAQIVLDDLSPYTTEQLRYLQGQADHDTQRLTEVTRQLQQAIAGQQALYKDTSLSPTDKLVAIINFNGVINAASAQQNNIQLDLTAKNEEIATLKNVAAPSLLSPAVAGRAGGPSRRSGVVIGAIIGLVIGLLMAVFWEPVAGQVRSRQAES
jgi:hypothetical protein